MFPSACPFLEDRTEPLEGLSKAVSCAETECPWFDDECMFIERLLELMIGPPGSRPVPESDESAA